MPSQLAPIAVLLLASQAARAAASPLFKLDASQGATVLVFEEIERDDRSSLVEVTTAGGSVAARSAFVLQASCALLAARSQPAFRIEEVSKRPARMRLHFLPAEQSRQARGDSAPVINAGCCDVMAQHRSANAPGTDRPASHPTGS